MSLNLSALDSNYKAISPENLIEISAEQEEMDFKKLHLPKYIEPNL